MTSLLPSSIHRMAARITSENSSDGELLARHLAGEDPDAFSRLVRRHAGMVYGTCRRVLGNSSDADDAFQVTFVVLFRRAASFVNRTCVGNFLYGVAYHTALKAKAMAGKRRLREANVSSERREGPDPELLVALDEELAKLPEKYREVLVLCELEGRGRSAVAERLGIPLGTISSRLAIAHRMLEKRLRARGFAPVLLTSILMTPTASAELINHAVHAATVGPPAGISQLTSEVMKMLLLSKWKLQTAALAGLACIVMGGAILAPSGIQARDDAKPVEMSAAEKAVQQLGDADFKQREAAEKSLRSMGKKAIPAIKAGLPKASPEAVERSEKLLRLIHKDELERFVSKKENLDSPVWKRFRAIAGDSAESRKLYVELMGDPARAETLENLEGDAKKSFEWYVSESKRLDKDWSAAFQAFVGRPSGDGADIRLRSLDVVGRADVLRCLFAGARPLPEKVDDVEIVRSFLDQAHFIELAKGLEKEPFRKLYLAWLQERTNPKALTLGLRAALCANIAEAVPFARTILANPKQSPLVIEQAIYVLGNCGELKDLLVLEPFRNDERNSDAFSKHQLREVATAMMLLLRKEKPEDYGFTEVQYMAWWVGTQPAPFRSIHWFEKPVDRDAALAKAGKWLEAQPKPKLEIAQPKK